MRVREAPGIRSPGSIVATVDDVCRDGDALHALPGGTRVFVAHGAQPAAAREVTAAEVQSAGLEPVVMIEARRMRRRDLLRAHLTALGEQDAARHICLVDGTATAAPGSYADARAIVFTEDLPRYGVRRATFVVDPLLAAAPDHDARWRALVFTIDAARSQGLAVELVAVGDPLSAPRWHSRLRAHEVDEVVRVRPPRAAPLPPSGSHLHLDARGRLRDVVDHIRRSWSMELDRRRYA